MAVECYGFRYVSNEYNGQLTDLNYKGGLARMERAKPIVVQTFDVVVTGSFY